MQQRRHIPQTDDDARPVGGPRPEPPTADGMLSRRAVLRLGAGGAAALGFYGAVSGLPSLSRRGFLSADGVFGAASQALADGFYTEVFPTSPLIMFPFSEALPIPKVLQPSGSLPGVLTATTPQTTLPFANGRFQTHQVVPSTVPAAVGGPLPEPIFYTIKVQVAGHDFTSSPVLPIDRDGRPTNAFDRTGKPVAVDPTKGIKLPQSTIYGFNGTFPGPAIHARYGQPVLLRLDNQLQTNPDKANLPRADFGSPDQTFLIHLHNGHTTPESDGNPHYFFKAFAGAKDPRDNTRQVTGYPPTTSVDNVYLNFPAGGDDAEKQSFLWFHDHRINHTGSNVYKGLVGLYPFYDPKDYTGNPDYGQLTRGGFDNGNENEGLQLPGVPGTDADGNPAVLYDIPLALFDCRLDDGVTVHHDIHDDEFVDVDNNNAPIPGNRTHPEWWGRTFYKHFSNHGFVGDLFTVNGKAYPVLEVRRRKYRFRLLDASVARIYEFKLMRSAKGLAGVKAAKDLGFKDDDLEGQFRLPDGRQCMQFMEIATDGGLLPEVITRDSFELWPSKRREVVIDFTQYQDTSLTKNGDVIFLTDVMKMPTGRIWESSSRFSPDPDYKVPMMAFKIVDDPKNPVIDHSVVAPGKKLRPLPKLRVTPKDTVAWNKAMNERLIFEVKRGSAGGEIEWLVNGVPFDPATPLTSLKNPAGKAPPAVQPKESFALWEMRNGGGGWVHPMHLHQEEHRTVMRNGRLMINPDGTQKPDPGHPDDGSREDVAALDPGESVIVYRSFRDFTGDYVAHCHNLAHEDHAMMFGWTIT